MAQLMVVPCPSHRSTWRSHQVLQELDTSSGVLLPFFLDPLTPTSSTSVARWPHRQGVGEPSGQGDLERTTA